LEEELYQCPVQGHLRIRAGEPRGCKDRNRSSPGCEDERLCQASVWTSWKRPFRQVMATTKGRLYPFERVSASDVVRETVDVDQYGVPGIERYQHGVVP
jgi:hypothetical protein